MDENFDENLRGVAVSWKQLIEIGKSKTENELIERLDQQVSLMRF